MTKQFDFVTDIADKQLRIEGEAWNDGDDHDYMFKVNRLSLVFEYGLMMEVDVTEFLTVLLHDLESSILIKEAVEQHIEGGLFTEEIV